jgi:dGTPase
MNREEYQKLEDKILAPYAVRSSQSRGRKYPEPEHEFRTCFQRDRDRIIHSTAFRRLEYKTQVFVIHEGDYYRTRLTHTLEVAQIARSIARALALNTDLVEAIALGHDIGHTPFGHSGEEALKELLQDQGGFDHNLQGLRVVDYLEQRYPDFPGLNLTFEVREGLIKHSTRYDFGYRSLAESHLPPCYGNLDLSEFYNQERPSLEAQVVDIADEIAYDNHDLDDGLTSGLLTPEELDNLLLWKEAETVVRNKYTNLEFTIKKNQIIRTLIDIKVKDLINTSLKNLKDVGSVKEVKQAPRRLISFSPEMEEKRAPLRNFLFHRLYHHYRVIRMAEKAKRIVRDLFNVYLSQPTQLPSHIQDRIKKDGVKRAICDYIASMTDRYAQDEYKKLFDPLTRV